MDRTLVAKQVFEIVEDTLRLDRPLRESDRLVDDLGADSVDQVSIILALEDEFGGELDDERAKSIATVGQVIDTVFDMLQQQGCDV